MLHIILVSLSLSIYIYNVTSTLVTVVYECIVMYSAIIISHACEPGSCGEHDSWRGRGGWSYTVGTAYGCLPSPGPSTHVLVTSEYSYNELEMRSVVQQIVRVCEIPPTHG